MPDSTAPLLRNAVSTQSYSGTGRRTPEPELGSASISGLPVSSSDLRSSSRRGSTSASDGVEGSGSSSNDRTSCWCCNYAHDRDLKDIQNSPADNVDHGTERFRNWLAVVRTNLTPSFARDGSFSLDIADIDDDLDAYDETVQRRRKLNSDQLKNEESSENGTKSLIAALTSFVIAAVAVYFSPTQDVITSLAGTLAPVGVSVYMLSKECRRGTEREDKENHERQSKIGLTVMKKMRDLCKKLSPSGSV
jgi:hypothetical protein